MVFLKHILTGIDGESYDIGRVLFLAFAVAFLAYTGYDLVGLHNHFDSSNFGMNSGALLGGGGAGIGMKAKTEPNP